MALASQGAQSKLCMEPSGSPHTFNTSSEPYEFLSENIQKQATHLDLNGIRGTRSHAKEVVRAGIYTVAGTITMNPSPLDLDLLLPRICGTAESSDVFALAETIPAFGLLIDRVAQQFQYTDCYINRATFRSQAGGLLELSLDILGKTEITGTSYPALTLGVLPADAPFVHEDSVVTLAGAGEECMSIEIVVDNVLDARFANAQTAGSITPQDRVISVNLVMPYTSDETSLYEQAIGGIAGTIKYTNGAISTLFTFGILQTPDVSPVVPGKSEITLPLAMIARKSGTTEALVVTNDSAS
ncbi:hypothetical protein [uncultured Mediterranean phage uvDeep-CGR2-KM19-C37]|nr:hypothetical protein [uncultured Mediterranean phage uvDeep-CGR2-KM19-C37]